MHYVIIISIMIAYTWNLSHNFLSSVFCACVCMEHSSYNGINNEAIFIVWKKQKLLMINGELILQGETHLNTAPRPFSSKIN